MTTIIKTKEDLFNAVISNKIDGITFCNDLTKNEIVGFSKIDKQQASYKPAGFIQKLNTIYSEKNPGQFVVIEKNEFLNLRSSIPNIDGSVADLSRPAGVNKVGGFTLFNHWNPSPMMLKLKDRNEGRKKAVYEHNFNFDKYKNINYLIDHLLNIDENKAFNDKKQQVDLKKHFLNLIAHYIQYNKKTGQALLFISPMHGTGKNVFANILKTYFGDFYADVNNDTFTQQHNGIISNKLFLLFNESEINYKDYEKVSSKLKAWISDEETTVRKMREDQINQKSLFNMIANSNNRVPFKIEHNDRRWTVIRNKSISLKEAVYKDLQMDVQDFVFLVELETEEFLADLLNLQVEEKLAIHNALMTDAKKHIIKETNKKTSNVNQLIKENNITALQEYFIDCDREDMLDTFLKQVSLRFLTANIVNDFLHINVRDASGTESRLAGKLSKKTFWDKELDSTAKVVGYKDLEGKARSVVVRVFEGFKSKNLADYMNNYDSEKGISNNCNDIDYDEVNLLNGVKEEKKFVDSEDFQFEEDIAAIFDKKGE